MGALTVLEERPVTGIEVLQRGLERRPDVVLVDYWLPETDACEVTRELLTRVPDTTVMHLSGSPGPLQVEAYWPRARSPPCPRPCGSRESPGPSAVPSPVESPILQPGAAGVVHTLDEPVSDLEEQANRFRLLTPRERDVLWQLARGRTVDQLARHLGITYGTTRTHVSRLLAKTGSGSQLEVVAMARDQGLVP